MWLCEAPCVEWSDGVEEIVLPKKPTPHSPYFPPPRAIASIPVWPCESFALGPPFDWKWGLSGCLSQGRMVWRCGRNLTSMWRRDCDFHVKTVLYTLWLHPKTVVTTTIPKFVRIKSVTLGPISNPPRPWIQPPEGTAVTSRAHHHYKLLYITHRTWFCVQMSPGTKILLCIRVQRGASPIPRVQGGWIKWWQLW